MISDPPQFVASVAGLQSAGTICDLSLLTRGNYHLKSVNSPARNAGDPNFAPGPGEYDIDDDPRVLFGVVDIGADEINDCDSNGTPDAEDIANCVSNPFCMDCNGNGILDGCDVDALDPDGNGAVSLDCDVNGVPDECDPDCDGSGLPDVCKINNANCLPGPSCQQGFEDTDCNNNNLPDTLCEGGDCNNNTAGDVCDILFGLSEDNNANGIPDECEVVYVDADATGANNGSSWADAFVNLQDALSTRRGCETVYIWVAEGTYWPDRGAGQTLGDRLTTFQLLDNLELYGGFLGNGHPLGGETLRAERDPTANVTTLSGDIGVPIDDTDNSYHVVVGSGVDTSAVIDGFTITGGNANGSVPDDRGGGMYNGSGSPTVSRCTFFQNKAIEGGGMRNWGGAADPVVSNCVFDRNIATGDGGGMHSSASSLSVTDCVFSNNQSGGDGAGMYHDSPASGQSPPNPIFTRCQFIGNIASSSTKGGGVFLRGIGIYTVEMTECRFTDNSAKNGGGLYAERVSATFTLCRFIDNSALPPGQGSGGAWIDAGFSDDIRFQNCLFGRNMAKNDGGGVYFKSSYPLTESSPVFVDCTIAGNTVTDQFGAGGGIYHKEDTPILTNCILWCNSDINGTGETAQIYSADPNTYLATATYSDWQGHFGGTGNISAKPRFFDPDGMRDGIADNDFFIEGGSPCIDAAASGSIPAGISVDLIGTDRTIDDPLTVDTGTGNPVVDMGAYEFFPDCNANTIRDDCEINCDCPSGECCGTAGCGTALDLNVNGVPDDCDCAGANDCGDIDGDGVTDDTCKWFGCGDPIVDACYSVDRIFADGGGAFGACEKDGFCNLADGLLSLKCFAGTTSCERVNLDYGGAFGSCEPDGFCNLADALHANTCFAGTNPCTCDPCPGGGMAAMQGPATVGVTDLVAVPVPLSVSADIKRVRIFARNPLAHLQAYQLHVAVSGGQAGQFELVDIRIEDRADYVFAGAGETLDAFNVGKGQMINMMTGGDVATGQMAYLATFTYRATADAVGTFVVDILHDESNLDQTFLVGAAQTDRIEVFATTPGVMAATQAP